MEDSKRFEIEDQIEVSHSFSLLSLMLPNYLISLINIHQPCDEYKRKLLVKIIKEKNLRTIQELVKLLEEIPELREAATKIEVPYGPLKNEVGRLVVSNAAGTNGGFSVAKTYYEYGISTVIFMHIDYNEIMKLKKTGQKGNLVILGHLAANSVGLNALADRLELQYVEVLRKALALRGYNKIEIDPD